MGVKMAPEEKRRLAKVDLLRLAKSFGVEYGKVRMLGVYSLKSGYRIARLELYLTELEDAGLLHLEGNEITFPEGEKERKEE